MRLCPSSILILTCFSCVGFYPNGSSAATPNLAPETFELAKATSKVPPSPAVLRYGSRKSDVQKLQTQLKRLGYYSGVIDGQYNATTEIAVAKFQKAKGLKVDGLTGLTTRERLQADFAAKNQVVTSPIVTSPIVASPARTSKPTAKPKPRDERGFLWWLIFAIAILGSIGSLFYLLRWFRQVKEFKKPEILDSKTLSEANKDPIPLPLPEEIATNPQTETPPLTSQLLLPEKTSRLVKLNIVDELIQDLRNSDPAKRRKAIWDLGQQGDSRAIQHLADLIIDADSQESSLILAALAEIGIRTLKPMNRALAISIQDESPQVRQNAIRDLTRVYDMMGQMSQMLLHALEDPDAEVQATARYALTQMNRMRGLPEQHSLPEDSHNDSQI